MFGSSRSVCTLLAVLALLVSGGVASAATVGRGQPDPTFGSGGFTGVSGARLLATSVQSDGKVVAVGDDEASPQHLLVVRLNSNGTVDSSFNGGHAFLGPAGTVGRAVAVQSDGKIVVAGVATGNTSLDPIEGSGIVVERLNSSGSADGGFGSGGVAVAAGSGGIANALAIQSNGKIVVGGSETGPGGLPQTAFARFNTNGTLDGSFGSGGVATFNLGHYSVANAIVIDNSGRIVFGGSQRANNQSTVFIAGRLNSNGSPDSSFGSGGAFQQQFANGAAVSAAYGVAVQSDNKLVLSGVAGDASLGSTALFVRLTSGGSLDGSFGSGGVTKIPAAANGNQCCDEARSPGAYSVVVSGGEIVGAGMYDSFGFGRFALWGLNGNGSVDSGFGSGGRFLGPQSNTNVQGMGLAVDSGGDLVVDGFSSGAFASTTGFAARFGGPSTGPAPGQTSRIGLMGRMGFVSPGGVIGVQVGCFGGQTSCSGHITMDQNGKIVGQRNFDIGPESGGFQNIQLTAAGARLLRDNRPFHLLTVNVTIQGGNGQRIFQVMHLARWIWGNGSGNASSQAGPLPGPIPPKGSTSRIGLMGRMGFVSPGRVIGVEVGCFGQTSCAGHIAMSHGGQIVGQRNFEIGPESGGFQNIQLTAAGARLLRDNRPFHLLAVSVTVTGNNNQRTSEVMHLARWIWR